MYMIFEEHICDLYFKKKESFAFLATGSRAIVTDKTDCISFLETSNITSYYPTSYYSFSFSSARTDLTFISGIN